MAVVSYDDLNYLVYASGKAKQASYSMQMTFGRMSEPLTKVQKVDSTKTAQSYDFTYKYEDSNHPTAPTQIGHEHLKEHWVQLLENMQNSLLIEWLIEE